MTADHESQIDRNDECIETAIGGFASRDEKICKYYRLKMTCPSGEGCRFMHTEPIVGKGNNGS